MRFAAARRVRSHGGLQQLFRHRDAAIVEVAKAGLAVDAGRRLKTASFSQAQGLLDLVSDGTLADLALQANDAALRAEAARRFFALEQPPVQGLIKVAIADQSQEMAEQALAALNQRSQLKQVAKKARIAAIRERAEAMIAEQREAQAQPSQEQVRRIRRAKLQALRRRIRNPFLAQQLG